MKRDTTGKFVSNWNSETKQRASISLTNTARRSLDREAHRRGISRSEVIERFARTLEDEQSFDADKNEADAADAQINSLQEQILEQQHALATLQYQKQELEALLENAPDAIARFDRQIRYLYANRVVEQALGFSRDSLLGRAMSELMTDSIYLVWEEHLRQVFETAQEQEIEFEFETPFGVRFYQARLVPELDTDRTVQSVIVVSRDITDTKQAEQQRTQLLAAQETERRVATILENITDAFVAFDRNWHYTYVNQAAAQILQKIPEELIGKHVWNEIFPDEVGSIAYKELHRAVAEQVPVSWEELGEPVQCWLEANAYPSAEGVAVYFRDITERKQAEAEREQLLHELEIERARFEAVLRQMPAGVILADAASGKLVLANEQAKQIVGYGYEQSLELEDYAPITPFEALHSDGQVYAPHEYPLARSLQTGEVVTSEEMELHRNEGSRVFINITSAPILDSQEQIVAAVVIFQDVTDYKQVEKALRESEERLRLAVTAAQLVVWDMDLQSNWVLCSANALDIWGLQEGTAEDFFAVIHPDDRQRVMQAAQGAIAGEEPYMQEYRVIDPRGMTRWLNSQGRAYLDNTGRGVRIVGVSVDITERKQMEAELHYKERQQQFLIELNDAIRAIQDSQDIMWQVVSDTGQHFQVTRCTYGEIDATQEYVIVDRDYCNGVASVVGRHHMDSFGPELIAELKQGKTIVVDDVDTDPRTAGAGAAAFDAIQTKSLLCVPLVKAGRFVALLVLHHISPRHWTKEEVVLLERIAQKTWLAVERSRAEEEWRESEARLQLALKAGRMGTWDWDIQTGASLWSEGHFMMLGLQPNECKPSYKLWASRLHPDDLAQTEAKLQQAIAEKTEYYDEYRLRWSDGSIHWVEARGQFTYDAHGNPKHSIGVVIDITERKQAEEALRQALQKLNFHFENSPMAVIEWDRDFRVTRWSAGAERILGWKAEEMLGKSLTEIPFVLEEDLEPVAEVCQQLVCSAQPHIFSYNRNYTKDRNVVHCEWYNSSLRDESGRMTSILSLVLDVTERKQAEQEREQLLERERLARSSAEAAQQQLATIFDTSPVGLALLDETQRFIAINEALAEINGLTREQHLGYSIPELFGQSEPKLVEVFHQLYTTGNPFISPNFAVNVPGRSDRRPGYYNVYYLPTVNSNRQVEGVLVYVVDVTERVQLELAQRFLSEASAVLASSLDYQTTLERVAQLTVPELADWCTVHMVEEDGAIEQIAVAHIDPAKLEWAYQIRDKYPLNPDDPRGAAYTLRTGESDFVPEIPDELLVQAARDSEHLEILRQVGFSSVMTVPLRTQARVLGVISFVSAESGRRYTSADLQLAEELARRASLAIDNAQLYRAAQRDRAKAETANRIKDEFLAVLSHELRSPLNPILGWSKLLRTGRLDATKTQQALETIERNAKLQAQLIEDLLDVSRILQGKMTLNVAAVNLEATIEAALETVRLAAEAKHLQIQTTFNPISGTVSGDTNRLQQVVWNLLSNAMKFTPTGGRIEVLLEQVGTDAQIQVKDTGKGISPDFLPYVFDYFRQEDGTTTRKFGGLGLGLAIVRHFTELHGGTVQADSPGQNLGAIFTIRLPLNIVELEPACDRKHPERTTDLAGVHVLVVDDDADMRELAAFTLIQSGAQVTTAASAAQALTLLHQSVPDLLLCDIGMPEMDGYSLIRQIRKSSPEQGGRIPAIALTAYAGEINQQQALAAGFGMHISKPVEPEELVKAITRLLTAVNPFYL